MNGPMDRGGRYAYGRIHKWFRMVAQQVDEKKEIQWSGKDWFFCVVTIFIGG